MLHFNFVEQIKVFIFAKYNTYSKMLQKIIFTAFIAGISTTGISAQTGSWKGELKFGGTSLPLVFNFSADGCTMDSPAQGVKGLPTEWMPDASGKVTVRIPAINGTYEGQMEVDSITGKFTQHGYSFPLTLHPGEVKFRRPQTPKPPYPYTTEEVSFANGEATLRGTLTLPKDCTSSTPVLIMITGSGLQNRDEEVFGHKPFAVIADALARQGIASLRFDDRGFGESTGDVVNCTTYDLRDDAASGIELLRKRFKRVGALGHSEGGTIAMMLAGEGKADFAVSLAGMTVSGKELLLAQNRDALAGMGLDQTVTDNYCRHLAEGMDAAMSGKDISPVTDATLPASLAENLNKALMQFGTPYMREFLKLEEGAKLGSMNVPLLALNGTRDSQVDCDKNLGMVKASSKGKAFTVKAYEGLNHLFQHSQTGSQEEYGKIEETISPEVLGDIAKWINGLK